VLFTCGLYNTISFNQTDGGECQEIAEKSGKTWFEPFENQEVNSFANFPLIMN